MAREGKTQPLAERTSPRGGGTGGGESFRLGGEMIRIVYEI